jgi:hypothetical protein
MSSDDESDTDDEPEVIVVPDSDSPDRVDENNVEQPQPSGTRLSGRKRKPVSYVEPIEEDAISRDASTSKTASSKKKPRKEQDAGDEEFSVRELDNGDSDEEAVPKKKKATSRTSRVKSGRVSKPRAAPKKKAGDPVPKKKGVDRQAMQLKYLEQLNAYSAVKFLTTNNSSKNRTHFATRVDRKQEWYFECLCGKEEHARKRTVRCTVCKLMQHAKCVGWREGRRTTTLDDYVCPHCSINRPPVPSGATLIVTPASIAFQWVDEIAKHIRVEDVKVFVYEGMKKHGYLPPQRLAAYDVVITTYETLSKEVNYVDLPHPGEENGRVFRYVYCILHFIIIQYYSTLYNSTADPAPSWTLQFK